MKNRKDYNISNKKKIIIILIILMLVLLLLVILKSRIRTSQEMFEYIYSNDMDEETFSPEMIHIVIAAYEGDINPKAISKATYYMITNRIPEYLKNCKDNQSLNKYFEKNAESIYLETGIENYDDFKRLIDEFRKLSGNLKLEYAKFDRDSIKVNKNNLEVILKIKYQEQDEISLNMKIKNKKTANSPAIEFYK